MWVWFADLTSESLCPGLCPVWGHDCRVMTMGSGRVVFLACCPSRSSRASGSYIVLYLLWCDSYSLLCKRCSWHHAHLRCHTEHWVRQDHVSGKTWVWIAALALDRCVTLRNRLTSLCLSLFHVVPTSRVRGRVKSDHASKKWVVGACPQLLLPLWKLRNLSAIHL